MRDAGWFYNLVSLVGLAVVCLLAWASGGFRRGFRLTGLAWGLGLQLLMGGLIFALPAGGQVLLGLNTAVVRLLGHARAGIEFCFGPLAVGPGQPGSLGFIFAVQALPTVVFFMALTALLYHAGVMQRVVLLFGRL
ncbi:MAG: hypothetical protein LDL07_11675, partial [Desulfarculus sp.]|nr:hypothetical protein [Desulfarculus sp.]